MGWFDGEGVTQFGLFDWLKNSPLFGGADRMSADAPPPMQYDPNSLVGKIYEGPGEAGDKIRNPGGMADISTAYGGSGLNPLGYPLSNLPEGQGPYTGAPRAPSRNPMASMEALTKAFAPIQGALKEAQKPPTSMAERPVIVPQGGGPRPDLVQGGGGLGGGSGMGGALGGGGMPLGPAALNPLLALIRAKLGPFSRGGGINGSL